MVMSHSGVDRRLRSCSECSEALPRLSLAGDTREAELSWGGHGRGPGRREHPLLMAPGGGGGQLDGDIEGHAG